MPSQRFVLAVTNRAKKDIRSLRPYDSRVYEALLALEDDPYRGRGKKGPLKGVFCLDFSLPGGQYRAAYTIDAESRRVVIFLVGAHEHFYQKALARFRSGAGDQGHHAAARLTPSPSRITVEGVLWLGAESRLTPLIVDLHCHTNAHSGCAIDAPATMLLAARDVGLGAVAITEHDYAWQGPALMRHAADSMNGFRIIPSVELTVFAPHSLTAHILVFADDPPSGPIYDLAALREYASAPNRALVQAHPYRYHDGAERVAELLGVHAIEVDSGNVDAYAASQALALADRLGLPAVAGSDAHRRSDVGMYATRFDRAVQSAAEIAMEIRAGRVTPVRYNQRTRDWE